jgi:hypothetical protein
MRVGDEAVDKSGGLIQLYLIFKADQLFRLRNAENLTQQRQPERLTFAFFVALVLPVFRKRLCGALLFRVRNVRPLKSFDAAIIPDRGLLFKKC